MKYKKSKLSAIFLLSSGLHICAQEETSATGGEASGSGGFVSFSIGQVVYTTNTGTTNSMTQGVQQPYEISKVTGILETEGIALTSFTYPNPTTDFLTLKVENRDFLNLSYQLFDLNGKLIETQKLGSIETNISMTDLIAAIYFLKVMQDGQEVETLKIIKN